MIFKIVIWFIIFINSLYAIENKLTADEEAFVNKFISEQNKKFKLTNEQKKMIKQNIIHQLHPKLNNDPKENLKPLYELGVGGLYASFPDYPGAANNKTLVLPFPSAIFRGNIFESTKDDGVRGLFFNRKYIELDISFDGTLPSDGKDNKEREGMPELDTLLEFGPKVRWKLINKKEGYKFKFNMNFATRFAVSSDFKNTYGRGISFNPFLEVKFYDLLKKESLLLMTLNFKFATRKLQDYYYGVNDIYQTSVRDSYIAQSGLMETSFAWALYYPIDWDIWLFGGSILSSYQNAANINSPLHSRDTTVSIIFGFYWNFNKSEYLVISK